MFVRLLHVSLAQYELEHVQVIRPCFFIHDLALPERDKLLINPRIAFHALSEQDQGTLLVSAMVQSKVGPKHVQRTRVREQRCCRLVHFCNLAQLFMTLDSVTIVRDDVLLIQQIGIFQKETRL